jgi:hypothetical protein
MQRGSPRWHPASTKVTPTHHLMCWHCLCPLWSSQCHCRGLAQRGGGVDPRQRRRAERQSPLASSEHKGDANTSSDALAVGRCGGLDGGNSGGSSSVALLHSAQHEHFVDSEGESMGVLMIKGLGTHNRRRPSDWKWAASREVAQSVGKSVVQSSIVQSVVQRVAKARETKCVRSWINLKCRPV